MGAFAAGKNVTFIRKETVMSTQETYLEQIQNELKQTPSEYLPALLNIIHTFRESVYMNSAEDSFRIGWREIQNGQYEPISRLWDGIDK
jgi:hypothetical protein